MARRYGPDDAAASVFTVVIILLQELYGRDLSE